MGPRSCASSLQVAHRRPSLGVSASWRGHKGRSILRGPPISSGILLTFFLPIRRTRSSANLLAHSGVTVVAPLRHKYQRTSTTWCSSAEVNSWRRWRTLGSTETSARLPALFKFSARTRYSKSLLTRLSKMIHTSTWSINLQPDIRPEEMRPINREPCHHG